MQRITPLFDRIILTHVEQATETASGIIIPGTVQEKTNMGRVEAVGAGRKDQNGQLHAPIVSVGDTVLYGKYAGTECSLNGKDYTIVREEEILAIIK